VALAVNLAPVGEQQKLDLCEIGVAAGNALKLDRTRLGKQSGVYFERS
jgi:hypothetical protein